MATSTRTSRSDEGFTLIETLVALFVIAIVMAGFVGVITSSLRDDTVSRQRQAASQIATQLIESMRDEPGSQAAMYFDPDPTVVEAEEFLDADLDPTDPSTCLVGAEEGYDPDGGGPLGCEEVVREPGGVVRDTDPWVRRVDNLEVFTWVTLAPTPDYPPGTRRVTVVVTSVDPAPAGIYRRSAIISGVSRV